MEARPSTLGASLRRSSVAIGVVIGLLAGSMLTAFLTTGDRGGASSSSVASVGGSLEPSSTLASGDTTATTAAVGVSPPGGLSAPSAAGTSSGGAASGGTSSGGAVSGGTSSAGASSSGAASGGTSSGGAAPIGATSSTAAPAARPSSCAGMPASGVRGVTDTVIKIGVGLPDLRAAAAILGPGVATGDQKAHFEAHLAALRKRGVLPICGRDIQAVYRSYNIFEPSQSRAVCQAFVNDEKVFAVVALLAFRDPNCVTQENKTLLLDAGGNLTNLNYQAAGGRLYGLHPPTDVQMHMWAAWGARTHAKGKKVGLYYNNSDPEVDRSMKTNVVEVLRANGIDPVVATTTTPGEVPPPVDPNDSIAVQKFRAAGVQVVYLTKNIAILGGFMREAKRQGYRPEYLMYGSGSSDAATGTVDPEYFDGTKGILWEQINDYARGVPPSATSESCIKESEAAGIKRPRREWGEWNFSLQTCDFLTIFTAALKAAGRTVTTDRVALGVQAVRDLPMAQLAPIAFASNKPWAVNKIREAQYYKECKCWKNTGQWMPLAL